MQGTYICEPVLSGFFSLSFFLGPLSLYMDMSIGFYPLPPITLLRFYFLFFSFFFPIGSYSFLG
ncbi:hypothetical protein F4809DRAFT_610840 [Biscogniauxia mediterranea]|nr:hypothetical protein F4809DRAFT_610840 [Biscogniauxia mediterranea]